MTIYLAGYTGRKPEQLKAAADRLNAIVADIRFYPRSRVPHWKKEALQSLLGDRYKWLFSFGNRNYKRGGPIDIVNPAAGVEDLAHHMGFGLGERELHHPSHVDYENAILLCACVNPETCHRTVVGEYLKQIGGFEVEEMEW